MRSPTKPRRFDYREVILLCVLSSSFVIWVRIFYSSAWIINFSSNHDAFLQSIMNFQERHTPRLLISREEMPFFERVGLVLPMLGVIVLGSKSNSILRATFLGCLPVIVPGFFYAVVLGGFEGLAPLAWVFSVVAVSALLSKVQRALNERIPDSFKRSFDH